MMVSKSGASCFDAGTSLSIFFLKNRSLIQEINFSLPNIDSGFLPSTKNGTGVELGSDLGERLAINDGC